MGDFEEVETLILDLYDVIKDYKHSNYDNLFTSISDTFYKENYHSDILCYLFKFNVAKEALIEWFNQKLDSSHKINFDIYKDGDVARENGHRDISIYSKDKKRIIIIENKSNDANDQEEQLLGYVETYEKN